MLSRSTPPEWVNRSESSPEVAEEDVSSSSITLVDEESMALIKGRVYPGGCKLGGGGAKIVNIDDVVRDDLQDLI